MSDFFLADDLSGALDAAAAFHRAGRRVRTLLRPDAWSASGNDEVVALTTETRNATPADAAAEVTRVLTTARAHGGRLLFKKIDSTMRGPVAAELAALAAAMPGTRILFTPANPAVGRTVRDGVLLVRGVPVAETEFSRDPASPVRESSLKQLLGAAATDHVVIADAETEADLAAAVARMEAAGQPWVAVGSGALARTVAARSGKTMAASQAWPEISSDAVLMVCGSAHPDNRAQAERLQRERGVPLHELRVAESTGAVDAAVGSLRESGAAALLIETTRTESDAALHALAGAAAKTIARSGAARLFVTGGETAFAICCTLGISALPFLAEIEPGVSISAAATAQGPMLLAVKPGGFGDPETWVRVWDRLRQGG